MRSASLGPLELFGELLDATLDVALEMVGPLVLREHAQHLPQRLQALPGIACLAQSGLGRPVLRREVGGHGGLGDTPRTTIVRQQELQATGLLYLRVLVLSDRDDDTVRYCQADAKPTNLGVIRARSG